MAMAGTTKRPPARRAQPSGRSVTPGPLPTGTDGEAVTAGGDPCAFATQPVAGGRCALCGEFWEHPRHAKAHRRLHAYQGDPLPADPVEFSAGDEVQQSMFPDLRPHVRIAEMRKLLSAPKGGDAMATEIPEDEAGFMAWVLDYAHLVGRPPWLTYHTRRSKGSDPGFPDLVLVRPPRLIFAEIKTERGQLTGDQEVWANALLAVGADSGLEHQARRVLRGPVVEFYVWRPSDRADIIRVLA